MRSARTLSRSDTGPPLAQYRAYFTTGVTVSQGSFTKWSKKFFPYFRDFLANKKEKGLQAALEALFFVLMFAYSNGMKQGSGLSLVCCYETGFTFVLLVIVQVSCQTDLFLI